MRRKEADNHKILLAEPWIPTLYAINNWRGAQRQSSRAFFAVGGIELSLTMPLHGPLVNIENAANYREGNNGSRAFSDDSANMITVVACSRGWPEIFVVPEEYRHPNTNLR
jgi:hypothetical protein